MLVMAVLAASRDSWPPQWPHATPKVAAVAVLGCILNAGFSGARSQGGTFEPLGWPCLEAG